MADEQEGEAGERSPSLAGLYSLLNGSTVDLAVIEPGRRGFIRYIAPPDLTDLRSPDA